MRARVRAALVALVVLVAGAFLGSAYSQWRTTPQAPSDSSRVAELGGVVRVEVLNAAGIRDLARDATDRLRRAGFDVVYFGNADTFDRDSSVVLDRSGRLEAGRAVADVLGIRNVRSQPDSNLYLDVSVWLGREWGEAPRAAGDGAAPRRPFWDPRRWLGR
jgi:hypothetical protein